MKQAQAAEILGMDFSAEINPEITKLAYRRACQKYHPDKGGSTEMMQAVNEAFSVLQDYVGNIAPEGSQEGYGEALNDAINAIITMPGLVIEICGLWVWVSGETFKYKDQIKAAGFKWASKKLAWYFRPEGWAGGRGKYDMNEIRGKYGSEKVNTRRATPLHA